MFVSLTMSALEQRLLDETVVDSISTIAASLQVSSGCPNGPDFKTDVAYRPGKC